MSRHTPELISIVIPFYKELDLIERAVSSVLDQRLPAGMRLEIVIGNDSDFDEEKIRAALVPRSNAATRIVSNRAEKGAGNARNAALDAARGDVVAFLDADDYWRPGKLLMQLRLIETGANFISGAYQFDGNKKTVSPPTNVRSTAEFFKNLGIGTSTVVVRRELLGEERFKNFRFSQDTELWARLAGKDGFIFAAVPDVVAVYSPSTRTANKLQQFFAFATVVKQFRLNPKQRADIYIRYTARGVLNHYLRR
jgi:teichuronic acid biosynthesis glycosyltransferase TuaG